MKLHTLLGWHCSSVLLKRKPAALFTLPRRDLYSPEMGQTLRHYGLEVFELCRRGENALVILYTPALLERALGQPEAREALGAIGYPAEAPVDGWLSHLKGRICCGSDTFPHEIGFFLGYPTEDVLGFMEHKGKNCKDCGLWKVYGDVQHARALFAEYQSCRRHVLSHLEGGGSLYNLPTALAV